MSIIAHIGKPGSFSHMAGRSKYGPSHTYLGCDSFSQVFRNVAEGHAELGVVPIENSLAGSIYENYDLFDKFKVNIVAEQYLKVEHFLLAKKSKLSISKKLEQIKTVYSHPKALEQCKKFFEDHPQMKGVMSQDTATASAFVATSNDETIASIGGLESAHLYRLQVLAKNIENDKHNYTRFIYISKSDEFSKNSNKCTLLLNLRHTPGSLVKALSVLSDNKLNMTKIESRPIHGKMFEYRFYVDFEYDGGKASTIKKIINQVENVTDSVKLLGVYEAGMIA